MQEYHGENLSDVAITGDIFEDLKFSKPGILVEDESLTLIQWLHPILETAMATKKRENY